MHCALGAERNLLHLSYAKVEHIPLHFQNEQVEERDQRRYLLWVEARHFPSVEVVAIPVHQPADVVAAVRTHSPVTDHTYSATLRSVDGARGTSS